MNVLNFGCNLFKLPGFTNIDIDPANNPDLLLDIRLLKERYEGNSVDFIHAGHFFEHLGWEDGKKLMRDSYLVLKPYSSIVITIPDYTKAVHETIEDAERIILNYGNHVSLYNIKRLEELAKQAGFRLYTEVELDRVPWLLLPAGTDPKPELWQTSFIATKTR